MFDPADIKARRLQDEDKTIAHTDRPERHQLVNSTLSDNPVLAPDTLFPPPDIAAGWAYSKISLRTQYIFCDLHADGSYPEPTVENPQPYPAFRRSDLLADFIKAVSTALNMMFVQHLEVPYLWHYKRDAFSVLENQGQSSVQFLERDELWQLYNLGLKFRAIHARCAQITNMWGKIKAKNPEAENSYLTNTLLASVCMMSIEAAAEGYEWLSYHYPEEIKAIKEEESLEEGVKRLPERSGEDKRHGPISQLVKVRIVVRNVVSRADAVSRRLASTFLRSQSRSMTLRVSQYRQRIQRSRRRNSLRNTLVQEHTTSVLRTR